MSLHPPSCLNAKYCFFLLPQAHCFSWRREPWQRQACCSFSPCSEVAFSEVSLKLSGWTKNMFQNVNKTCSPAVLVFPLQSKELLKIMLKFIIITFKCCHRISELLFCPQGWQKGQSTTSCPTLRHFHGAWLQTTERFLLGQRWAEEAETFSHSKPFSLTAGLWTKQPQCLATLEAGWWCQTQVSQLWHNRIWFDPCEECKFQCPQPKPRHHGGSDL